MPFNEGQLKAIQQRDASILVSAPAGSGKTKILVSRIVELLKEGRDIFDFLVLTFTEAAGNEMKQRLTEELNQLVLQDIDEQLKEHLQNQINKLPHAYITNFHGFCNLLLMKYGYLVGVMPGFEINSDPTLIKKEVLKECEEKWILNEEFQEFLSLYFPHYSLEEFDELLMSIDELSHSIDNFYEYIEDIKKNYYDTLSPSLEEWTLFPYLKDVLYQSTMMAYYKFIELKNYCQIHHLTDFYERPDEQTDRDQQLPTPFEAMYDFLTERLDVLSQENITYDTLSSMLKSKIEKSYNMNWKEVDLNVKNTFNKMKASIRSYYDEPVKKYFPSSSEDFIEKLKISYKAIELLVHKKNLLYQFQTAYQVKKRELNQLDFSDLERYTHELLKEEHGIVDILYHRLKEIMVDEYQDTNQIQESLLLKIAHFQEPHIPLFMVGDMKQSIYRFRQADPQIFSQKYDTFALDDETCLQTKTRRIDLVFNYRSSKVVLDSINYIFNQIMDKKIGGLEYYYDDSARLNYDYVGKENNQKEDARKRFFHDSHLTTELLIDIYNPQSSLDKEQYEAHMVAQKILKLKKEMKLNNQPVDYKDMVVLMRSTTSFLTFKKVFDLYHIPNHIVLSQGFIHSNEIENMITFLKAIDNPYDDLAMMSVLRQPYSCSHISMETLGQLRLKDKTISLYEAMQESGDIDIQNFIHIFNELYHMHFQCSPYELLNKIYEVTDYPLFVCHLVNGEQRKANLDLFLEYVLQLQNQTPYLHEIIEHLTSQSDIAPAQLSSGNNTVEFMTIHKSKGLEFPIVFVCNMHKQFNTQDSKNRIIIDKQLGIALKPRVKKNSKSFENVTVEYENQYLSMIAKRQLDESINEEMRIFYVALTRASQKLIMTGVIKDLKEITDIQDKLLVNEDEDIERKEHNSVLLYDSLRKTNNYLYWVLASILRHPQIIQQCLKHDVLRQRAQLLQRYSPDSYMDKNSTEHAMFSFSLTSDEEIENNIPTRQYQSQILDGQTQEHYLHYVYPYQEHKPKTLAVTKLQKITDDHFQSFSDDETSLSINAADKGTLVHLLLSYLTFKDDNISDLIQQLYDENLIDDSSKAVLLEYKEKLENFISSPYYHMIQKAQHIYKEKSFSYYDNELDQVIHGIFDLVFIYDNHVYVLDYKTDRVSSKASQDDLISKHQGQLNYYQKVLKEMYQKENVHAIVYYLHISMGVEF